jgi:hypothetical protein
MRPGLPVVPTSGYAELSGLPRPGRDGVPPIPGIRAFLEKPYSAERLTATLAAVLGESRQH